jgi:hypothetical protein
MKRLAFILGAAFAAGCAVAPPPMARYQPTPAAAPPRVVATTQTDDWVIVFKATNGTEFALKHGSCIYGVNSKNVNYIYCLERIRPGNSGNLRYDAIVIDRDSCKDGYGTLKTVSLDASTVYSSDQVVSGTDSPGAMEFRTLCEVSSRTANVTTPPVAVPIAHNQSQPAAIAPAVVAAAAMTDWVQIVLSVDEYEYSLSPSSCRRSLNASRVDTVLCVEKVRSPTGVVTYYFAGLDAASCNEQNTEIYTMEMGTGNLLDQSEVLLTGGTVGSKVGATLCKFATKLGRPL